MRRLFRKTKTCPLSGSRTSTARTSFDSPSKDLRRFTGAVAKYTRTARGRKIMAGQVPEHPLDHRAVGHRQHLLRAGEREWAEAGAEAPYEDDRPHGAYGAAVVVVVSPAAVVVV